MQKGKQHVARTIISQVLKGANDQHASSDVCVGVGNAVQFRSQISTCTADVSSSEVRICGAGTAAIVRQLPYTKDIED